MSIHIAYRGNSQHGQSVVEFVVLTLLLVPLLLFISYLGKYSDMNYAAVKGSRYVAWERTVSTPSNKSDETLRDELRRRLFTNTKIQFRTGDAPEGSDEERNPLWTTHGGERLLKDYSDVVSGAANNDVPGTSTSVLTTIVDFVQDFGGSFLRDKPDIETRGLYRAEVTVNVADVPRLEPLDEIGLHIRRHHVILADGWDASSPDHARKRVRAFVPTAAFEDLGIMDGLEKLRSMPSDQLPIVQEIAGFRPGHVVPDAIPDDRLGDEKE